MNTQQFFQSFDNLQEEVKELKALQKRVLLLLENFRLISADKSSVLEDWISVKETCTLLSCSEVTLWKIRKEGIIPFTRIKRTIRFKRIDVLNYLNQIG
ncbi:helix-turn-helix domain-containing protein [Flavobacterium sandaracinum]|uniref:DNA-binding protein n=1 Tax=Flavobacterium sandaracinum TaxID=2541733 RepID=A0A4R5D3A9_9FLAO|nr:helix-turn-helix domain-containing protein [Flavobacterium sandaracinum]TDE07839.1 DNA-binding protein [Flavobacterium sandaracinum]